MAGDDIMRVLTQPTVDWPLRLACSGSGRMRLIGLARRETSRPSRSWPIPACRPQSCVKCLASRRTRTRVSPSPHKKAAGPKIGNRRRGLNSAHRHRWSRES